MAIKPQIIFTMEEKHIEIYSRIGKNIRNRRLELKLTQEQLAKKTSKVDRSKISDMENGKEDYMLSTLLELANGLNIDIEELVKKKKQ